MNDTLKNNLIALFKKNRIVFWYDAKHEYSEQIDSIELPDVTLIHLTLDNQIQVKHKLLVECPSEQFLVYADYEEPSYQDNWLLGLQLCNGQFRTEQSAILQNELNLNIDCIDTIRQYSKFFSAASRTEKIRPLLKAGSIPYELENALLAVNCNQTVYSIEEIINKLIEETFLGKSRSLDNFESFGIWNILWDRLKNQYGYEPTGNPSIKDFVVYIFEQSYRKAINNDTNAHSEALLLMKKWKSLSEFKNGLFEEISGFSIGQLGIESKLRNCNIEAVRHFDDYRVIEEEIILSISQKVESEAISSREISQMVADRKDLFWFDKYHLVYEALLYAREIQELVGSYNFTVSDYSQGLKNYSSSWYKIDLNYRRFTYCIQSDMTAKNLLVKTQEAIDKLYLNKYLRPLNEAWSPFAEKLLDNGWKCQRAIEEQKSFFKDVVEPLVKEDRTAVVIISDAMRYEVGQELISEINQTDRYVATIKPMLANAPTYTQVGMATLLPYNKLSINNDSSVNADDYPTAGKENRKAILAKYCGDSEKVKAFEANEVLNMTTTTLRDHIRDNKIIYVYQDKIDHNGEEDLIRACKDAVDQLKKLVILFGSSNTYLMYITADHGFLYQQQDLAETDFLADGSVKGTEICSTNRRFILGRGLQYTHGTIIKNVSDFGYESSDNLQVAFPNSILRFRLKGANTHFVHGGLSLQETVIPLIEVTKGRAIDTKTVELKMLTEVRSITSGTQVAKFFQEEPISDKCKSFEAKFGIYAEDGTLLSNEEIKMIDSTAVIGRDREFQVTFTLNKKADSYNGKFVHLVVQQQKADTGRFVDIINKQVKLSRGFELDF